MCIPGGYGNDRLTMRLVLFLFLSSYFWLNFFFFFRNISTRIRWRKKKRNPSTFFCVNTCTLYLIFSIYFICRIDFSHKFTSRPVWRPEFLSTVSAPQRTNERTEPNGKNTSSSGHTNNNITVSPFSCFWKKGEGKIKQERGEKGEKKERKKKREKSTAACVSVRVWIASETFPCVLGRKNKTCRPQTHSFWSSLRCTPPPQPSTPNSSMENPPNEELQRVQSNSKKWFRILSWARRWRTVVRWTDVRNVLRKISRRNRVRPLGRLRAE